jgi:fumarate reductase flavoprotein subunit
LPECLVFGARAGRAAARFAAEQKAPNGKAMAQAVDEERRLESQFLSKPDGGQRISTIREEMQGSVESGAGIYRDQKALTQSAQKLHELQERYRDIRLEDHNRTFNTELQAALELGFMLDVAESIVQCALARTESRGAHQRTDFPARDDGTFLAHSLVFRQADGSSRVEYLPVKITRWAPGERVYGQTAKEQAEVIAARRAS